MLSIFKSRRRGNRREKRKSKRKSQGSAPRPSGPVNVQFPGSSVTEVTPKQKVAEFYKLERGKLKDKQKSDDDHFEFVVNEGDAEKVSKDNTTEEIYGATLKRKKKKKSPRKTGIKMRGSKISSRRPSNGTEPTINPRRTYTTEIEPLTEEDYENMKQSPGRSPGRSPDFRIKKKLTTRVTEIENGVEIFPTGRGSRVSGRTSKNSANNSSFMSKPKILKKASSQVSMGKTLWDGQTNLDKTIQNVLGYSVSLDVDDDGDSIPPPAPVTEIENSGGKKKSMQQRRTRKPKFVDNDKKKKINSDFEV